MLVMVHGGGFGPEGVELLGPAAGAADLRAELEVGLAVDDEGVAAVGVVNAGHFGCGKRRDENECGENREQSAGHG